MLGITPRTRALKPRGNIFLFVNIQYRHQWDTMPDFTTFSVYNKRLASGQYSISCQLNSDWSTRNFGEPVTRKAVLKTQCFHGYLIGRYRNFHFHAVISKCLGLWNNVSLIFESSFARVLEFILHSKWWLFGHHDVISVNFSMVSENVPAGLMLKDKLMPWHI